MAKKKKKKDGEVLPDMALALKHLREAIGVSRLELASRLGYTGPVLLGKYERGDKQLRYETLLGALAPLGCREEAVDALLALYPFLRNDPVEQPPSPVALNADDLRWIRRSCLAVITSVLAELLGEQIRRKKARKAKAARRNADERWPDLKAASPERRRQLVERWPRYRTWAMAERVCEASIKAAANSAAEALELASFALFIAERIPGAPSFRSRTQGYCWAHIGNAQRVGEDFNGADLGFVRAWELWHAGADSDPDLLAEWKLFSLEASLRRAQHRFPDALERLDRASRCSGVDKCAAGRILLQKSNVLEQMLDLQGAAKVLDEGTSIIESLGDSHLLFAFHFNRADLLCRMQRYKQAAPMIPVVRRMAINEGSDLNLTRVVWLDAKIQAGLGEVERAISLLEQVFGDFTARQQPYDAALSALDLAQITLLAGKTAEVGRMAASLAWIFDVKGVRQEALAAIALFCEAAKRESVTVELTQQVIGELMRIRHSAPPRN